MKLLCNGLYSCLLGSLREFQNLNSLLVEIGWSLAKLFWNNGYATEEVKRCLEFGFENIELKERYSMAPLTNVNSI